MTWSRQRLSDAELEKRAEKSIQNRHKICKIMKVKGAKIKTIYSRNLKRCTRCAVYFSIPEFRCPCCGNLLRRGRRDKTGTGKNQPENDTRRRIQ